jgi:TetR/AcrR family transcriptional regulator, transcriptional repressor for nem operon
VIGRNGRLTSPAAHRPAFGPPTRFEWEPGGRPLTYDRKITARRSIATHRRERGQMARYDTDHKQATRQRIIETAGRRFKLDGIDGSGVAVLMKDAGLTNGAFYGHFDSKDDLVAAMLVAQLERQRAYLAELEPGMAGLEEFVHEYFSTDHRDARGDGCPSAALLDEIARHSDATRHAYTAGMAAIIDDIAASLGVKGAVARRKVLSAFALMVGALQLSRAVDDPSLSEGILDQASADALAMMRAVARR